MKVSIYIFISIISVFICQNIITSWNYDKVAMYDLQKINTFLNNFAQNPIDIPITLKNNTLTINNIKLIQIDTNLYDSLINYNTGLLLLAPNKITLYFNFSYEDGTQRGDTTLELKILTFKLKVSNDKTTEKKANFEIKMTSPLENYSIHGIQDKTLLEALKYLFCKGFQDNSVLNKIIPEKMETGLYNCYNEYYKNIKEFNLQTKDFFGNLKLSIKNNEFLYFCEDLLGEYKTAFCYYKGNVQDIEGSKDDKTLLPLKNERFSHNEDDLYNIFINNDLFEYSMDYFVKNYFEKNSKIYNNKTNTKQLSYDFTVNSLNKYFRGLEYLQKTDYFDCEIYIEKGNLNEVVYKVRVNIRDENKNYFEMRVTSGLTLDIPIKKSVRFDICIKDTKTKNVEILFSTTKPQVEVSDFEGLQKAIEESFDFSKNPICLNNDGISLRDYFAEISKAYAKEEGLYFEGPQLYQ
jgi:hypothetical protein